MDDRRVADYFVVAGLPEEPLPLEEFSNEAAIKPTSKQDPITDIAVIDKTLGEKIPKGFSCVDRTPSNFIADLNHGSIRCHEMYVCFRRGRDKPALTDVGVLYEGKERLMPECEVVHTTPWGSPANVNNGSNGRIYITYRRAKETAACDTLAVVDVVVILSNKGEVPPHAYHKIDKNINRGMVGSDIFVCYKKAMCKADILAYKPDILDRYPKEDYENFPLPQQVPLFCLPMGASVECWSAKAQHPLPVFSTFVLTLEKVEKVYGAAVTFYEEFNEDKLTDLQMRHLGLKNKHIREQYRILKTVHSNKCICLLSHWPFFDAFRKFLTYLYRISITGPHPVPLERHISHFMYDVPYPSPQRPRILVQLNQDAICLSMPEDSPLPQSGASFITMLKNLGPENCMSLLLYILHEQKILIHSLRPAVLTGVAEAVAMMIFPLHWQCAYIPLCPLGLSDMLSAPVPYIVGIDSRYFDLYDPPPDVVCVDLDTVSISLPDDKRNTNYKNLPKKASRVLQDTLHKLFDELSSKLTLSHNIDEINLEMGSIDTDFKRKHKETMMELRIQEAFLRFMACLFRGYKNYLKPITKAPTNTTTDATSLFDIQGFLKSRDKANMKFFQQLIKTQTFITFIGERSFVSDKDASLVFFDECTEKVDENKDEPKLIEIDDSHNSERTIFIMPPEPVGLPEGASYSYNGFPELKPELFLRKNISNLSLTTKEPLCPNSPISRRTKQEIRSSQKMAQQYSSDPMLWAKCLLSHCYSLWFIHLPAYINVTGSVQKCLKEAYDVLQKMQLAKLQPPDEICYRVMLQLCGMYNEPVMAVKVLYQMKRAGVQPNAITYGFYNKAVFEGTWPSTRSKGTILWRKVRNVIIGVAQFRRSIRRRSISLYSNSGSEYDQVSRTSIDSFLEDHGMHEKTTGIIVKSSDMFSESSTNGNDSSSGQKQSTSADENLSTGGVSDKGYSSMSREELKSVMQQPPVPTVEGETQVEKVKKDTKGNLRFNLPRKHKGSDKKSENGTQPVEDLITFGAIDPERPSESNFRARMGSIVRKSLGSVSSSGSHETIKGSMVNSSTAGLLMLSQTSLDTNVLSQNDHNLQSSMNAGDSKRKRHKSAGDYHSKQRSNSVFNNWRPRHISGDPSIRYHDTRDKDLSDDIFMEESEKCTHDEIFATDEENNGVDIIEEGIGSNSDDVEQVTRVSERPMTIELGEVTKPCDIPVKRSPIEGPSVLSPHSIGTPVTENDPLGLFCIPSEQNDMSNSSAKNSNNLMSFSPRSSNEKDRNESNLFENELFRESDNSEPHDPDEESERLDAFISMHEVDPSKGSKCNNESKTTFILGSGRSLDACVPCMNSETSTPSDSQPLSPMEKLGKRLKEVGRTNSSPGSLDADKSGKSSFWPVKEYLSSFQSPQKKALDQVEEGSTPDSKFKRLGSLRKHNERLSGALKFAAGALATKFNEIKQTIKTPSKYGSNSSLSRHDDGDSHTSEESYHPRGGRDVPRRGNSLDHTAHKYHLDEFEHLQHIPNGSIPSSSFIEQYIPLKEFGANKAVHFASLESNTLQNYAMETEISSCCRCTRCRSLLYDEEIMAGWSADDSNLNTTCIFCQNKIVPKLQIYIKDWRGHKHSLVDLQDMDDKQSSTTTDPEVMSSHSNQDPWVLQDKSGSHTSLDNPNAGFFFGEEMEFEKSLNAIESPDKAQKDSHLAKAAASWTISPASSGSMDLEGIALSSRRRCASECFTDSTDVFAYGSSFDSIEGFSGMRLKSPLSISIGENEELPVGPAPHPEMKKDFMERCTTSMEPITVPYLSPLVLRKELENILANEGDLSVASDEFVDEHPIIFWNLVWYFKRIEVPSHLPGFLLTARSYNREVMNMVYDSTHVLIRPQWDNTRIHEEVGLPMYKSWNERHSSHVVDALITETQPFNRPILHQIITSIQCNDVLTPIKLIMNCRRRQRLRRNRYRSMYRDIAFLSFVACGRDNIDHDAFDREYRIAFQKLSPMEIKRTQRDDRPRKTRVIWCRKVFGELEV